MLKAIEVTDKDKSEWVRRINLDGAWKLKDMRNDVMKFAKFMLGFTPRDYQMKLFDTITTHDKVGIVKGRQIGFSTCIALYCLWYAWFSKASSGANKNTKICVISKDDDSAKELLQKIKDFMYQGDKHMSNFLKGRLEHVTQLFSSEIERNNADQLKLRNGSVICSFPPTGKVRGTSNDILFIDEFAFINNPDKEKFFYADALPSVSETRGKVIISSTPNGYGDLFHELIDPEDRYPSHMFHRIMVPYSCNKEANYQANVKLLQDNMELSKFKQEYECDFTENDISFFSSVKVKDMFDERVHELNPDDYTYVCGVDYGMTEARTVVSLCTKIDDTIYRLYYKEFESGWDINGVIPFIEGLKDRFRINKIVVDHCAQGDAINKKMIELGWNVELFDFHTRKEETYCAFRNKLNKGQVKMTYDAETEKQFLDMVQEETNFGKLKIHKRKSGRDDIVDSIVMASSQFLDAKKNIKVHLV